MNKGEETSLVSSTARHTLSLDEKVSPSSSPVTYFICLYAYVNELGIPEDRVLEEGEWLESRELWRSIWLKMHLVRISFEPLM